jgi:hypothetical protein
MLIRDFSIILVMLSDTPYTRPRSRTDAADQPVSRLPAVLNSAMHLYDYGKASSRVISYSAGVVESSVHAISRPVLDRVVSFLTFISCNNRSIHSFKYHSSITAAVNRQSKMNPHPCRSTLWGTNLLSLIRPGKNRDSGPCPGRMSSGKLAICIWTALFLTKMLLFTLKETPRMTIDKVCTPRTLITPKDLVLLSLRHVTFFHTFGRPCQRQTEKRRGSDYFPGPFSSCRLAIPNGRGWWHQRGSQR